MSPGTSSTDWYKVTFAADECGTKAAILRNDFETLFTINGSPNGAALFSAISREHQLFYFAPGAVALARGLIERFDGVPSPAPDEHEDTLVLLIGQPTSINVVWKRGKRLSYLDQIVGRW